MKELYESYAHSVSLLAKRINELKNEPGAEARVLILGKMKRDTVYIMRMIERYVDHGTEGNTNTFGE